MRMLDNFGTHASVQRDKCGLIQVDFTKMWADARGTFVFIQFLSCLPSSVNFFKRVGNVAYTSGLLAHLCVHLVFHASCLRN